MILIELVCSGSVGAEHTNQTSILRKVTRHLVSEQEPYKYTSLLLQFSPSLLFFLFSLLFFFALIYS